MGDRVRLSHVVSTDDTIMPMQSKGKTGNARMWVYLGDDAHPYNVFDFTLNRCHDRSIFSKTSIKCFWPMPTEDTTVWWPAMRSSVPDVGHTCAAR